MKRTRAQHKAAAAAARTAFSLLDVVPDVLRAEIAGRLDHWSRESLASTCKTLRTMCWRRVSAKDKATLCAFLTSAPMKCIERVAPRLDGEASIMDALARNPNLVGLGILKALAWKGGWSDDYKLRSVSCIQAIFLETRRFDLVEEIDKDYGTAAAPDSVFLAKLFLHSDWEALATRFETRRPNLLSTSIGHCLREIYNGEDQVIRFIQWTQERAVDRISLKREILDSLRNFVTVRRWQWYAALLVTSASPLDAQDWGYSIRSAVKAADVDWLDAVYAHFAARPNDPPICSLRHLFNTAEVLTAAQRIQPWIVQRLWQLALLQNAETWPEVYPEDAFNMWSNVADPYALRELVVRDRAVCPDADFLLAGYDYFMAQLDRNNHRRTWTD